MPLYDNASIWELEKDAIINESDPDDMDDFLTWGETDQPHIVMRVFDMPDGSSYMATARKVIVDELTEELHDIKIQRVTHITDDTDAQLDTLGRVH